MEDRKAARIKRWRHCSFLGHVSMAMSQMLAIQTSDTATSESVKLAGDINILLARLKDSLAERR